VQWLRRDTNFELVQFTIDKQYWVYGICLTNLILGVMTLSCAAFTTSRCRAIEFALLERWDSRAFIAPGETAEQAGERVNHTVSYVRELQLGMSLMGSPLDSQLMRRILLLSIPVITGIAQSVLGTKYESSD